MAPNYQEQLKIAAEKKVPFIVLRGSFALGSEIKFPRKGGKVLAFASTILFERMIGSGGRCTPAEGAKAGHIGHVSLIILCNRFFLQ